MKTLLLICLFTANMWAQLATEGSKLKEYVYASDGFAMKFPYPPTPHTDLVHSDFKDWTVHLEGGSIITVRLKLDSMRCDVALKQLKSMADTHGVRIRESSVSGRPMWEEGEQSRGSATLLERYVCGVGRYYVLSFQWPAGQPRPKTGTEAMDSFRLVQPR